MSSRPGPSQPKKRPQKKGQRPVHGSKVKKLSEKQQIENLERAAQEFVCIDSHLATHP